MRVLTKEQTLKSIEHSNACKIRLLVRNLGSFPGEIWSWSLCTRGGEKSKRQITPDWRVAVLMSKGTSIQVHLGRPENESISSLHLSPWWVTRLYRSLNWVYSCISIDSLNNTTEKEMATHSITLAWRIPKDRRACWATVHGVTKGGSHTT